MVRSVSNVIRWLGALREVILSDGEVALSDCMTICWQTVKDTEVSSDGVERSYE